MSFVAHHKIAHEMITSRCYDISIEDELKEKEALEKLKDAINKVLVVFRADLG